MLVYISKGSFGKSEIGWHIMDNRVLKSSDEVCDWCWGSHACDLGPGDHTIHVCDPEVGDRCSEYDSEKHMVRWMFYLGDEEYEWSEWHPCDYGFCLNRMAFPEIT